MDLSVDESAVTQAHTGVTEKVGKQLKTSEVEFGDIYSEFVAPSPSAFVSKQSNGAKSAEKGGGANKEVPMDQGQYQVLPEGQSFPGDSGDFKGGALSLHQESKYNLLVSPTLPANPAGPSDFKPSPQTDSDEKKSSLLAVRVKLEDTTETHEDFLSESSESKPGHFLPYRVKTEVLVNKPELKSELEDLKLTGKHESLDSKPEHLPFVKCSDGREVDVKPSTLSFSTYLEGAKLKTEEKPESFRTAVHHETSAVKPDLKMETLEYNTFPDSSEAKPGIKTESLECPPQSGVKTEMKEEMLEADSTVLTPKFELPDGGADNTEGPVEKVQLKAEGSCAAEGVVEEYSSSPRFSLPISICEIPNSRYESREPTIAQLLQEKALYSFSEWPKDRVIINRLDSICQAILKGKWPSSSEQYDSPGSVATSACLANSLAQHHHASYLAASGSSSGQARIPPGLGFSIPPSLTRLPKCVPRGGACGRGAWRLTSLPLLQERLVAPPFLPELKRAGGRRAFDYETAAAAAAKVLSGKPTSPCHTATPPSSVPECVPGAAPPSNRSGSMLMNGWQEAAIDLTKSGEISTTSHMGANEAAKNQRGASSSHKLPPPPPITAPLSGSAGIDISRILQAGLIHPVTGQIVNGSLRGDDYLKRRRGRRRNVEALYSEFTKSRGMHVLETQGPAEAISHSTVSSSTSSPSPSPSDRPACHPVSSSSTTSTPTQTPPQPEIVAIDRDAAGKGLMEWLRQNPSYSMDLPTFTQSGAALLHGLVERPKQRRHRCKDPTKLDINSLTGEERVPVVHRGTGRRLGGAMAPAIKELSRWLDANSEYCVAPDWSDVVKHSGFLPEGKFSRILTEPVSKDASSRRRGRRPRSDMPKPLLSMSDSSPGLGPPLYMNGGLMGSMDSMVAMQNLGGSIPGIPISGIMAAGFPHGFSAGASGSSAEEAKNSLSMLPMMLHSIPHPHGTAIPQHALFGVGTMMAHAPPHLSSPSNLTVSSSSPSASVVTTTTSDASSPSSTVPADADAASSSATRGEKEMGGEEKGAEGPNISAGGEAAATISSTSRTHLGSAHLGAGGGSHLTFNPFLIPGMSHGLLYPHMFLPHGGIVALPAMPPSAANGSPSSPKRRRKRVKEVGEKDQEGEREKVNGDPEEKQSTVPAAGSSHLSASSTSPSGPAEETHAGPDGAEEGPLDSNDPPEEAASTEGKSRTEEAEEQKHPE